MSRGYMLASILYDRLCQKRMSETGPIAGPGGEPDSRYLIAIGLSGEPTARVKGSGGPQKKNS